MLAGYILYVLPFIYYSLKGVRKAYNDRQKWIQSHLPRFYITSIVVAIILGVFAYYHFYTFITMALFGSGVGLITVLYELPLIPYKGRFVALREWGFFKPIILTLVWWYLGAYGVAKGWANDMWGEPDNILTLKDWVLLAIQFIFMLVLCVLFDVRDYYIDAARKINTWPVKFGIKNTHTILIILNLLCIITGWIVPIDIYIKTGNTIVFGLLILISAGAVKTTYWWFYDLIIDGMMIIQWLTLLVLYYFLH
jgi:4-hydroxybenzoate polyprenyltransferase